MITLIIGGIATYIFIFSKPSNNTEGQNQVSNTDRMKDDLESSPTPTKIYTKQEINNVEVLLSRSISEMPELNSDFPCDQITNSFLRDVCHYRIRLSYEDNVMVRCAGTFNDCKSDFDEALQDDIKNKNINSAYVKEFMPIVNCSSFPANYQEICRFKKQQSKECENYNSGSKEANILKDVCELAKDK